MITQNATALTGVPHPDHHNDQATPERGASNALRLVPDLADTGLLDARGYRRPIATLPGYNKGRTPKSKGRTYPPDPPTVEEISKVLLACGDRPTGLRMHALIIVLWRTGLRISEALALQESDLHPEDGSIVVRSGKGGKRRVSMMDPWGWERIKPWLEYRQTLETGPVFCVIAGPTSGTRVWSHTDVRRELKRKAALAGVRKRMAPHQLRHAHAVELWREDVNLLAVQRQLGHARLDVTQLYLRSISPTEVLAPIAARRGPVVSI